jgi:hypothetical protein
MSPGQEDPEMAKTYTPDVLARRVFILVGLGVATEILVMVWLGFF